MKAQGGHEEEGEKTTHELWFVVRAVDVVIKSLVYESGQKLHEKLKGRSFPGQMFEYGQFVLRNVSAKLQEGT